ncbi:hypothetical protein L596_018711 [Steinernema carpocapsae]|uniref:Histidine kinase/HSP90-like ATPase domain-containing protein n=1 Tax=Steinernema carpocapsae TaxID=34508 RepID=A0A4U5N5X4_STECR|nr:hypothetical protein L596_018711 [Steinernema carpocapsae]
MVSVTSVEVDRRASCQDWREEPKARHWLCALRPQSHSVRSVTEIVFSCTKLVGKLEMSSDESDYELPKTPAKKKAAPKKTPNKKINDSAFNDSDDDFMNVFTNIDNPDGTHKALSIEQIYQKKSQLEHILLRPDTYVGSVEYTDKEMQWVYDAEKDTIVQRKISYVPGLYKIFDEILVNAADNKQRDPKMNKIKINIDKEKNEISVHNNGKGVPVVMHKEEKLYVPELIFGTLLTSSNYNDAEKKVTGTGVFVAAFFRL